MYFPYLRGKQFELEALVNVNPAVYANTLPILEPVSASKGVYKRLYGNFVSQNIPLILIMNPFYPQSGRLTPTAVQTIINGELARHPSLILGHIIDQRYEVRDLNAFLTSNPTRRKAIVFRFNPLPTDLLAIQAALGTHPVEYIIFDDRRTNATTRNSFNTHPRRVLITDGFQRQDKNSDYPPVSAFDSNYSTWRASGWFGIGDYLSIGDYYQAGGGQVYVVTLHLTIESPTGLVMHHFSSTYRATVKGFPAQKFAEANNLLVTSPHVVPLASSGLDLFRDWHARAHNPQLGAAKKASLMHHIELMSRIV
jgi:hypothetical protein